MHEGVMEKLNVIMDERLKRLENLSEKMDLSIRIAEKIIQGQQQETLIQQSREFQENWPAMKRIFTSGFEREIAVNRRDSFMQALQARMNEEKDYIPAIRGLDYESAHLGTTWLQNIVDDLTRRALAHLPSCKSGVI